MNIKITLRICLIFLLSFSFPAYGQEKRPDPSISAKTHLKEMKKLHGSVNYASADYEALLRNKNPKSMTTEQFEAWIKPIIADAKNNKSENNGVITIPVVVHVIHSGEAIGTAPNITDAQIQSQIDVLNNDFRRRAGTPGYNTNPVGADVMIEFALAKVDPDGNPTDGIDRVNMCQPYWIASSIENYVKPATIWDPTKYMNVWTLKFILDNWDIYAQFPDSNLPGLNSTGGSAKTDGIVVNYSAFGNLDADDGTFLLEDTNNKGNKGRLMTHEVGHFLGLIDTYGTTNCGTDYCADTPTAFSPSSNCNPTPSCDDPNIFVMFQNYMDNQYQDCLNVFTINQKERMMAVMNNSPRRMELKTSTAEQPIPLFANDAELKAEKSCNENTACDDLSPVTMRFQLYNRGTALLTSAVITYSVNGGTAQTINWTGSLAQNKFTVISVPTSVALGTVSAQIASVNGISDQRATNNTAAATIGNIVPSSNTNFTFELQRNKWGSNVNWNLKNSAGTVLYSGGPYVDNDNPNSEFPLFITENWILPANDCYTFTINDVNVDFLYLFGGSYAIKDSAGNVVTGGNYFENTQQRMFNVTDALAVNEKTAVKATPLFTVYPNPANDVLYISKTSGKAQFEIRSALGQLVKSGAVENNQVRVSDLLKGTYMIIIKDGAASESIKFMKK